MVYQVIVEYRSIFFLLLHTKSRLNTQEKDIRNEAVKVHKI